MKILKSKFYHESIYNDLPRKKIDIYYTENGKEGVHESIWAAVDEENNVQYLLNGAVMFSPYDSWGMEIPLGDTVDLSQFRTNDPDSSHMVVANEVWDKLAEREKVDTETTDVIFIVR